MGGIVFTLFTVGFFGWLLTPSEYYEAIKSIKDTQMYKDWLFRAREQEINEAIKNKMFWEMIK